MNSSPSDPFALLGQPRRPFIDPDALKDAFHRLAAAHHPDVSSDAKISADLNTAYAALRDPAARLRRLLELECPDALARADAAIPSALAERFMEVATLKRELDAFLHQQSAAAGPLAQALLASERFAQRRDLEKVIASLEADRAKAEKLLRAEDAAWDTRTAETGPRLALLAREFAYLGKWIEQLREAALQLSL